MKKQAGVKAPQIHPGAKIPLRAKILQAYWHFEFVENEIHNM
jgi:hypothetical protein